MDTKRTHIVIPAELVARIDLIVGKRGRSKFLAQSAEKELMRLRQLKAVEAAAGSWKDKDHPVGETYGEGSRKKSPDPEGVKYSTPSGSEPAFGASSP